MPADGRGRFAAAEQQGMPYSQRVEPGKASGVVDRKRVTGHEEKDKSFDKRND